MCASWSETAMDLDRETGEAVRQLWYSVQTQPQNGIVHTNAETGELEPFLYCTRHERPHRPFQVSRDVLHHHDDNDDWGFLSETQGFSEARNIQRVEESRQRNKSQCLVNKTVLAITKMYSEYDSYMEQKYKRYLEQKVHQESPNVNSVVLMLPVIFLFPFPAHLTVISIVIEICLHLWAHRRAKTSPEFQQFHSPLHEITSKFCAVCRISDSTNKISKLQERRKERSRNYVERVSVAT